jgi:hypothetical protein
MSKERGNIFRFIDRDGIILLISTLQILQILIHDLLIQAMRQSLHGLRET